MPSYQAGCNADSEFASSITFGENGAKPPLQPQKQALSYTATNLVERCCSHFQAREHSFHQKCGRATFKRRLTQIMGRDELRRETGADGFHRKSHGQVCLAHTRRPQKENIAGLMHEAQRLKLAHLCLVNAGLKAKVELRERLDERQASTLQGILVTHLLPGTHLGFKNVEQEIRIRAVALSRPL